MSVRHTNDEQQQQPQSQQQQSNENKKYQQYLSVNNNDRELLNNQQQQQQHNENEKEKEKESNKTNDNNNNNRKQSLYSQRSHGSSHDRRLSFLQYYGQQQQQLQKQYHDNLNNSTTINNDNNDKNVGFTQKGLLQQQQQQQFIFRPFTRETLDNIRERIQLEKLRKAQKEGETTTIYTHHAHNQEIAEPDPMLEAGLPLPRGLQRVFPAELIATPIEDIDQYYQNKMTFTVISKSKDIFRFSATNALFILSPFNPIRRVAIYMLVHPLFSFLVIVTILINCILMTLPPEESIERTEIIFTTIYTFESCIKVAARGFILTQFTYLRDPWNWLDFAVIMLAYLTMGATDLGNLSALRTFRVLRALKTVAIIPGMKTIVGAVIESVKNLKDVIILTCFSLSVFALLGLQVYMGVLTQKCIKNYYHINPNQNPNPNQNQQQHNRSNNTNNNKNNDNNNTNKNQQQQHQQNDNNNGNYTLSDIEWYNWCNNKTNWYYKTPESPPYLCGNSSQQCPTDYTCLQGFGDNPNYGYTNFDTFGWALLSSFRLMTQDSWETLYQMIIRVTGLWHVSFFLVVIFLGSFYLVNLILAIVAMSYDELQKKAEEEEIATAAEEAAYAEACRLAEEDLYGPGGGNGNGHHRRSRRNSRLSSSYNVPSAIASAAICPPIYGNQLDVHQQQQLQYQRRRSSLITTHIDILSQQQQQQFNNNMLQGPLNNLQEEIKHHHHRHKQKNHGKKPSTSCPSPSFHNNNNNNNNKHNHLLSSQSPTTASSLSSSSSISRSLNSISSALCSSSSSLSISSSSSSTAIIRSNCECKHQQQQQQQNNKQQKRKKLIKPPDSLNIICKTSLSLPGSPYNNNNKNSSSIIILSDNNNNSIKKNEQKKIKNKNEIKIINKNKEIPFVDDTSSNNTQTPISDLSQNNINNRNNDDGNNNYYFNNNYRSRTLSLSNFQQQNNEIFYNNNNDNNEIASITNNNINNGSSTYTSHSSRISYTSHGDIYGRLGFNVVEQQQQQQINHHLHHHQHFQQQTILPPLWAKDYHLRARRLSNVERFNNNNDEWNNKNNDNDNIITSGIQMNLPMLQPFLSNINNNGNLTTTQPNLNVKMKDVMVLNDIIEQASIDHMMKSNHLKQQQQMNEKVSIYYFPTEKTKSFRKRNKGDDNNMMINNDFDLSSPPIQLQSQIQTSTSSTSTSTSTSSSSLSNYSTDDDDYEKLTFKERLQNGCLKCLDILCVWDCFWCWIRVQELVALVVFDPFMELFITLCIVVNTLFMAMDHHNMDKDFENILQKGNFFFTAIFAIEAILKLVALSPKFYFREGWNIFDFVIVILSLLDVSLSSVSGLSVLRSFRLLRVFKLAKSWPTLNLLISIMGKTVGDLANLTFVLGIIIFIFAVMGMQLFGKNYTEENFGGKEIPRWNFKDFMHSFMIVFRVLCGEWIESMWDCMRVSGAACVPFFLATVVIGYLVVLNLFLALLLSSFGASNLSAPTSESADTKKLQEAFDRFSRAFKWIKLKLIKLFKNLKPKTNNQIGDRALDILHNQQQQQNETEQQNDIINEIINNNKSKNKTTTTDMNYEMIQMNETKLLNNNNNNNNNGDDGNHLQILQTTPFTNNNNNIQQQQQQKQSDNNNDVNVNVVSLIIPEQNVKIIDTINNDNDVDDDDKLDVATADILINEYPSECFPEPMYKYCPWCLDDTEFWTKWKEIRTRCYKFVEHKYFETLVISLILLSSMALALEDVNFKKDPTFMEYLGYMDKFFTIIFICEMLIKWLAFGFAGYFTNVWCWLDFVIVMVSVINLIATWFGVAKIQAFKTMRTLRALRPLRALSRFQGMRVVVNALIQAIPAIFNVLLVCLIFWLIFSIMGVQLFLGKFYQCIDIETKQKLNASYVPNKEACLSRNHTIWYNPPINFDNVPNAYLALFQVATFKGWLDIMNNAIDSKQEPDEQPEKEVNLYMYLYFVFFIIFGSFFTLNLFIGVIIDNFNEQKKKAGGSLEMFMTEDQKKYYNAMKKMGSKKPMKAIPRPRFKLQAIVFDVITNKKFDMIIMLFIALNMVVMSLDEYRQSELYAIILERLNLFFIAIFTAECLLKIFALRWHYFKEPWNIFDFVVVILSILGVLLRDIIAKYIVSPTLLRVVRVVKVGRVLRLVKGARGIRTLLFALAMSLPALFNICLLLFLVIFIYAIFGMSFFMNVKHRYGIDETFNFSTFFRSFILLFQMSTSAGWDGVLAAIMNENDCQHYNIDGNDNGDCGNRGIAIAFLVSYLIISFLIIINMYIAVILENYSQAAEDVHEGLTDDDYDMYYEIWQKFDPKGTQFIKYSQLSDFVHALEEPLQIPKPNKFKLISMDIPICIDDMCYCVDILDALTKDFFARKGHVIEETAELAEVAPTKLGQFEHISSTLWRQREEYCSSVIQKVWREYKQRKKNLDKIKED